MVGRGNLLGWSAQPPMVGTTTGTTIGITTRAAPRPPDNAIMKMLTRLLGEPVGHDTPVLDIAALNDNTQTSSPLFQDVLSFCHHLRAMRRPAESERVMIRMWLG